MTVLESEPWIGGRTSTEVHDGSALGLAATMLLSNYCRTVESIAEEGWQSNFESASDLVGVERGGRMHHVRASKPLVVGDHWSTLVAREVGAGGHRQGVMRIREKLDWENPVGAAELYYPDFRQYADARVRNAQLRDYLMDPACRIFRLERLDRYVRRRLPVPSQERGQPRAVHGPDGIATSGGAVDDRGEDRDGDGGLRGGGERRGRAHPSELRGWATSRTRPGS
jgi:hypothetical protein